MFPYFFLLTSCTHPFACNYYYYCCGVGYMCYIHFLVAVAPIPSYGRQAPFTSLIPPSYRTILLLLFLLPPPRAPSRRQRSTESQIPKYAPKERRKEKKFSVVLSSLFHSLSLYDDPFSSDTFFSYLLSFFSSLSPSRSLARSTSIPCSGFPAM